MTPVTFAHALDALGDAWAARDWAAYRIVLGWTLGKPSASASEFARVQPASVRPSVSP